MRRYGWDADQAAREGEVRSLCFRTFLWQCPKNNVPRRRCSLRDPLEKVGKWSGAPDRMLTHVICEDGHEPAGGTTRRITTGDVRYDIVSFEELLDGYAKGLLRTLAVCLATIS
ncbi:hypothetical protein PSPO01_10232 [Paraphaeosphaeria sporulosa]